MNGAEGRAERPAVDGTTTIAQEAGRWAPGPASSVQGGLAFLVGALATPLTGPVNGASVLVMASFMTALLAVAVVLLVAVRAGRSRRAADALVCSPRR